MEQGVVTREGIVDWNFQRQNAADAIRNLPGVVLVHNYITVAASTTPNDIKDKIKEALRRSATVDSDKIVVSLVGSEVLLNGSVRSFAEKEDAELTAWAARGITAVENNLAIEVPEYSY